jgi:very-short-patch-repair endonuclease
VKPGSTIEETLALHIRACKLPPPVREYAFDPVRRWRIDFAWPDHVPPLAVEVDGAVHRIKARWNADAEKHLALALAGWMLIRVTGRMVRSGTAIEALERVLTRSRIDPSPIVIRSSLGLEGLKMDPPVKITCPRS